MNATPLLMIIQTATMETMELIIMDVEMEQMDMENATMNIVTIIMTVMTSAKIIDKLLMMTVIYTNILVIKTTNGKIVYSIQHQMPIKSDMNHFSDAALPTSNEVVAMLALHQVASLC